MKKSKKITDDYLERLLYFAYWLDANPFDESNPRMEGVLLSQVREWPWMGRQAASYFRNDGIQGRGRTRRATISNGGANH